MRGRTLILAAVVAASLMANAMVAPDALAAPSRSPGRPLSAKTTPRPSHDRAPANRKAGSGRSASVGSAALSSLGGCSTISTDGFTYSLAAMADGTVDAWGTNSGYNLGTGEASSVVHTSPVPMQAPAGFGNVTAVAAGRPAATRRRSSTTRPMSCRARRRLTPPGPSCRS
jgi:Regulator of chromosome condensation (RCC1) repeat